MKKLLLLLLLFPWAAYGQGLQLPLDSSGRIAFDAVRAVNGVGARILYQRAKLFLAHEFGDYEIGKDTVSAGNYEMTLRERTPSVVVSMINTESYVTFSMMLRIYNGKYRYRVTDFVFNMPTITGSLFTQAMEIQEIKVMSRKKWGEAHRLLASQMASMLNRLQDYMTGEKE